MLLEKRNCGWRHNWHDILFENWRWWKLEMRKNCLCLSYCMPVLPIMIIINIIIVKINNIIIEISEEVRHSFSIIQWQNALWNDERNDNYDSLMHISIEMSQFLVFIIFQKTHTHFYAWCDLYEWQTNTDVVINLIKHCQKDSLHSLQPFVKMKRVQKYFRTNTLMPSMYVCILATNFRAKTENLKSLVVNNIADWWSSFVG